MCRTTLLASSALLMTAAASAEETAPLAVDVSGYLNAGVGYANPADGTDDVGMFRDGEIHVQLARRLESGPTLRARVEIEAFTTVDQIDENWVSVAGDFGALLIGASDTALFRQGGVGVVYPNGNWTNYYDSSTGGGRLPGDPGPFVGKDDSIGVRYWTEVRGLEVGVSWQPQVGSDGASDSDALVTSRRPLGDQFAFGGAWTGGFSDISIRMGGGYMFNDREDFAHAGAEVGHAGLTLAAFWNVENEFGSPEVERYSGGAMYRAGPWSFGGGAVWSEYEGGGDERFHHVGAGYDLAPGVTLNAALQYGENHTGVEGAGGYGWITLRF